MKRLIFLAISIYLSISGAIAQQKAIDILQQASVAYQKAKGVKASFRIQTINAGDTQGEDLEGEILLKGNKFKLTVPDEMITWFDGQNQWLYLIQVEEVNLSNPTEEELLMINPVNVFMLYRHGFDCRLLGEKKYQNKTVVCVEMQPQDKQSDLNAIQVYFDKKNHQPCYLRITNKDRSGSVINITQYQPNQNYSDQLFVFQQKEYPMATVIDLR